MSSSLSDEETSVVTETSVPPVPPALLLQTAVSGTKHHSDVLVHNFSFVVQIGLMYT